LGLHITIKNLGARTVSNIEYNATVVGGYLINPANELFKGEIPNILPKEQKSILIGPFFQIGRVKIIFKLSDKDDTNQLSSEIHAFTLGFLIICTKIY
ncbi:MAG: hypothetical protein QXS02_05950, partial [Candidatus Thermoplasmatota archaeon]